jgi:tRNA pseudouridine-54 N-methylase
LFEFIITDNSFPEDLRSGAIAGLTASIELKKFDPEAISSLTEIFQCLMHDSELQGRDLQNAKLRLQANLFSLGDHESLTQTCIDTQSHLASWIVMLQDAAWDDMVSSF